MATKKAAKKTSKKTGDKSEVQGLVIPAPNFATAQFKVVGNAPLVMHKFSQKSREQMKQAQMAGSQAKNKNKKDPKDFEALYEGAKHVSVDGWTGIPASAFRAAMIRACTLVGFAMTQMRMTAFVIADGYSKDDGTPLVRLHGKPEMHECIVRVSNGQPDVRVRPMWREWWATVTIQWDLDQFSADDVANLLARAGIQVGLLEGRPASKNGPGMGWGTFDVTEAVETKAA